MVCITDQSYSEAYFKSVHLSAASPTPLHPICSQSLCVHATLNIMQAQPLAHAGQVKLIYQGRA